MGESDNEQIKAKQFAGQSQGFSESVQMKGLAGLARAWGENAQLKQIAEQSRAFSESAQMKGLAGLAKAWGENTQLKQIAEQSRAFSESAQMKGFAGLARAWSENAQLKQIAEQSRALSESAQIKRLAGLARAWGENAQLKQIAEQSRAFSESAQMKGLAGLMRQWAESAQLREFTVSALDSGITFDQVLDELTSRTNNEPGSSVDSGHEQVWAGAESSLSLGDYFTGEVISHPDEVRELSKVPTWFLYFWLFFMAPLLYTLEHWEDMRANLVDINARMPQIESISEVQRFIRTNLAGKPGDIRLVNGSGVRLRVGPGMKEDVIMTLPRNAPVVVLGKEDRTWLLVSYEHEGFVIDGYISTKFLKKVRR